MVGARVPQEWQQQISVLALTSGRKEAEVIREALGQYLGRTDPGSIKGAIAHKYLNNLVEQDHRFIKRLVNPGMGFGSFKTARRTLRGYEAMNMIRKGQVSWCC